VAGRPVQLEMEGSARQDFRSPEIERSHLKAKIGVALASHESVPIMFAYDLANLCTYTAAQLPEGVSFGLNLVPGTYVHSARQQLIGKLIADGCTHILWLDTDMRFPKDSLFRLLEHDLPMVGINYSTRGHPASFVAIKTVGTDEIIGCKLVTDENSEGIEEVDAIGFGMVLMKVATLRNMPKDVPWFWFDWLPKRKQMIGEDVYFCSLYRKAGNSIHADHDLSRQCAHIGSYEYTLEDVRATKEVMAGV
jgi:hypothetical protein